MKSSIRNEIKAQIIRAGYTMQEVVDLLHDEYGWSDSVSNLSGKLQRVRCGIGRPWSWPMCWGTMWSGRNGGNRMTDAEKKLLQAKHRMEEAQARDRVKERKARTRRLIQEGAILEKAMPEVRAMELSDLESYLLQKR